MLKVELETKIGPDGKLSPEGSAELRQKMLDALKASAGEQGMAELEKLIEEKLKEVRTQPLSRMAAVGLRDMLKSSIDGLEYLAKGTRGLAQRLDEPSHIYELGGAGLAIITAEDLLAIALENIEHVLACASCLGGTPPPKTAEPDAAAAPSTPEATPS